MKKAIVTGILVKKNEEYLLIKKQDGIGPYPGTYLTPGGYVEENERIDTAALRELFEETGISVKNLKRIFFDDDFTGNWKNEKVHLIMLLYTADYDSGDIKPAVGNDDKLLEIKWFSIEEIKKLPLSPPLKKLFEVLYIL